MLVMTEMDNGIKIPDTLPLEIGEKLLIGDLRGGYRYHTSLSSSHNPCDNGRLLCLSIASRLVH